MSKSYRRDPDFQDNSRGKDRRQLRQTAARNKRWELDRAAEPPQAIDFAGVFPLDFWAQS